MLSENDRWLLSYYRTSEIQGALFFGRLARVIPAGPLQVDMSQHFADEAAHASAWTKALSRLDASALKLRDSYQDQYFEAVGPPANVMEVLAVTQVFEQRVLNQYTRHLRVPNLDPVVRDTLLSIMEDEKWHIQWIRRALVDAEERWGKGQISATLRRFRDADREVYARTLEEHKQRLGALT